MAAEQKTKPTNADVDAYINAIDDVQKRADCFRLKDLFQELTGKPAVMWGPSIIGFDTYRYTYASGRSGDWPLIGFSPRKQNITLYIVDGFDDYADELAKLSTFTHSKSCLYIKHLDDIDIAVLAAMAEKSIRATRALYSA